MAGYLLGEEGTLAGAVISLREGEEWTLGRDPVEASIVLKDPSVSRKHLLCKQTKEGILIENLSVVNPITCDGNPLSAPTLLQEGTLIQIGGTTFRFTEHAPEEALTPLMHEEEEDLSTIQLELPKPSRWLLKVVSGPNAGAEFSVESSRSYILGRDANVSDVVFHDLSVSRQHAKLSIDHEEHPFIEDLHTRNGVLVNGELTTEQRSLASQDLIALGTTSFLLIDTEQIHETIISPPTGPVFKASDFEKEQGSSKEPTQKSLQELEESKSWKDMIIPTKHLIVAGIFGLTVVGALAAMFSLFHTEPVTISTKHETERLREALKNFSSVQYSFNEASGKLFLIGHVLTNIEKQELSYTLSTLSFLQSIEDTVIIDELVWQNMNALLLFHPDWQAVHVQAPSPGHFVLKGFVQTLEQAQALSEYINTNFPYPSLLDNQVSIGENILLQVQSLLLEQGFDAVSFGLANGELVLTGRIDDHRASDFSGLVHRFELFPGVRAVKNFTVATSADTSRVDLSSQFTVTGFSLGDNDQQFVVINQKIFSKGDFLQGMLITDIQATVILLEKDGIKFRINYNLQ
ncbi:MAG: EscD/YscD/HrpQ family type III secretion system inner membrane ring protein [Chlamydiae bacterium]|nr:EscD/YscD/HrpQ family type III secretion system inner membrane ring protein [Chlamydiota bacterium]